MFDCAVVGSGVAGISAALTLKANGKSFVLLGSPDLSAKIGRAECIRNYPGLSSVSGQAFCQALKEQLKEMDIPVTDERVTGVYALKDKFSLLTESGAAFESKTVILTTGVEAVKQIPGEAEFIGRGVSYCATCDGAFYRGKRVAVIGLSADAPEEAEYLSSIGCEVEYFDAKRAKRYEIKGGERVEALVADGVEYPAECVFILRSGLAPDSLLPGLGLENGHIKVGPDMSTNIPGVFAAGDCTGAPYQVAKAAGEGNIAALSASKYIENKRQEEK